MSSIRAVCVYCGSSAGADPAFAAAARALGKILADNRIRLVYGGGSIGMMGALARAVLAHGGYVTGVIPGLLGNKEHMLAGAQ
jgi:predicted Rossmann-fold nucleotide-binding protein